MKIRKWAVIFSSVCAIASMQLTVNAEADRQALKVALLEYSWENFTSPSMKLGGIENYPMVAYQYSKMDEFMEYYNDHGPSYSNSLDDVDITSDRKMDDFHADSDRGAAVRHLQNQQYDTESDHSGKPQLYRTV